MARETEKQRQERMQRPIVSGKLPARSRLVLFFAAIVGVGMLLYALLAQPASGGVPRQALCDANLTATGAGYYRVLRTDANGQVAVISQHTRVDQAIIVAIQTETVDPALDVWVDHEYWLRVECPVPAPSDTVVARLCITLPDGGVACSDPPPDTATAHVG